MAMLKMTFHLSFLDLHFLETGADMIDLRVKIIVKRKELEIQTFCIQR